MNEKQSEPEPYVTFQFYQNGQVTIKYKGKTLTTKITSPEFRSILVTLTLYAIFQIATEPIGKLLEDIFEGEKKDEPEKT